MSDNDDVATDAAACLRYKLMSAEEVYVYKIPPLKTSGGHRAEDWNLSTPLQTCSFLVERMGDRLLITFLHDGDKVFAQSSIDTTQGQKINACIEQVVDSSRYFVIKIQGTGGREALVGFGFRDREQATDLRESLQYYEKSIQREKDANAKSLSGSFSIPKLAEGEKIHVDRSSGKTSITKKEKSSSGGASGAIPLLKKPPPPASPPTREKEQVNPKELQKMAISLGEIDLDAEHNEGGDGSEADGSEGAVYAGDQEQWATEFNMK